MEIPAPLERTVNDAVAHHLETELGNQGLLLTADGLSAAEAETAQLGARLQLCVMRRCYPISRYGQAPELEFESEHTADRLHAGLAFGSATARVLAPDRREFAQPAESVELLCAVFNVGIGLVDSLCDEHPEAGVLLLELLERRDLRKIAEEPQGRGWLRATLPMRLAEDPTVAFTADMIEVFFELLHETYPDDARSQQRCGVGDQLGAALMAERRTVDRSADRTTRRQLIDCSRLTSVLPFQIIETLVRGHLASTEPSTGTQLGEAMWRIDDLVDLCQDARSGALNSVLLAAATGAGRPRERDRLGALEHLRTSTDIARVANEAADRLVAGLQGGRGRRDTRIDPARTAPFLYFIQRYVGIMPRPAS